MSRMTEAFDAWFDGKVAIVTGASLGIGRGIAEALLDAGASVALIGRSAERMTATAAALSPNDWNVLPIGADVSNPDDAKRLVEETVRRFGRLDFLVNAAGVRTLSLVHETPLSVWDQVMNVQLTGTFLCCQAAVGPLMASGGRVVNLSSMFASRGRSKGASYAAAKAGVVALTKVLASELAPTVTVNAISPGPVETERVREGVAEADLPMERARRAAEVPLKRMGQPDDIAWAALYLLGPGGSWITGQVLHVNGGALMP